jgi:raffinose/stachyose/melibiose transport system substrate-binding protein
MTRLRPPRAAIAAAVLAVGVALAACGGSSSSSGSSSAAAGSTAVPATTAASTEPVSLKIVNVETGDGPVASLAGMIKAYEAAHPNVTIKSSVVPYANYRTTVKLQAASANPPDIIEGDVGPGGVVSSLAQANLLEPLDALAAKNGWAQTFGALATQLQVPTSGKGVGHGPIWGVPAFGEILGVHYNKALLAQVGDPVPTTFAEFEKTLADAKAKGVTPIMIGGLDKWPWSHFYDILADHFASPQDLTHWFEGQAGSTIDNPQMAQAGTKLQDWYAKGYFENGPNGVSDADAVSRFSHGDALFKVDGPWATPTYEKALGDKLGFFLLPPDGAGGTSASSGWLGWVFTVAKNGKHKDVAADFVNFMASSQARGITLATGTLPAAPGDTSGVPAGSALSSIVSAYGATISGGDLVPYMDVAYPQAAPHDMLANAQSMAAGHMTPDAFLKNQQEAWDTYNK